MNFEVNRNLFENKEVFLSFYNNYKTNAIKLTNNGDYSCVGIACTNCPLSRTALGLPNLELHSCAFCRGLRGHIAEYKRYDDYLKARAGVEVVTYETPKDTASASDRTEYDNGGVKEVAVAGKPKTMFHLLDPNFVEGISDILTMGALKYSADNWKKVPRIEYERAAYHHWNEYRKGNKIDDESGKSHLYHLATNAMFLDWFDRENK